MEIGVRIQVFPIEKSPGRIVSRTHLLLKLGLARVFARAGFNITPEHWALLSLLWEKDGPRQKELAGMGFKDQPNTARMLASLEKNGFITRRPDPGDRRGRQVFLTPAGRQAQAELTRLTLDYLEEAFGGFSPAEYGEFIRLNRRLEKNLTKITQQPDKETT